MPRPQRLLEAPLSPVDSAPAWDAALLPRRQLAPRLHAALEHAPPSPLQPQRERLCLPIARRAHDHRAPSLWPRRLEDAQPAAVCRRVVGVRVSDGQDGGLEEGRPDELVEDDGGDDEGGELAADGQRVAHAGDQAERDAGLRQQRHPVLVAVRRLGVDKVGAGLCAEHDPSGAEGEEEEGGGRLHKQHVELQRRAGEREEGDVDDLGRVVQDAQEVEPARRVVGDDEAGDHRDDERLVEGTAPRLLLPVLRLEDAEAGELHQHRLGEYDSNLDRQHHRGGVRHPLANRPAIARAGHAAAAVEAELCVQRGRHADSPVHRVPEHDSEEDGDGDLRREARQHHPARLAAAAADDRVHKKHRDGEEDDDDDVGQDRE
mmetsp:Transcript_14448/g.46339  ORF Transcript_14448/g.46339 Transcript_14448/m.46339 type:complete len:375 (+) Transcript_14448:574-1698(+)